MTIQLAQASNATMEGADGSAQQTAQGSGQTYEQITESLKRGETGEETTTSETTETTPTDAEVAATTQAGEDEFRTMTDEEIGQLPAELQKEAKALRKRFQAAYTKKTQDIAEVRRQADFATKFQTDPEFRAQAIRQFQPAQTTQATGATGQPPQPPPQYVQARRQTLPAELQWMAESLALGDYQRDLAFYQSYIQPMQTEKVQERETRAAETYKAATTDLAERHPGWETAEDDMVELVEFLKSPALRHDRFGNKLELLYRLVAGDKAKVQETQVAIERTAQAIKNKSVTSSGSRSTSSNLEERIRKAKTNDEAWELIRQNVRT